MQDEGTHRGSFLDRARSAIENAEQDERVKQATAVTEGAAEQTREASKNFSRARGGAGGASWWLKRRLRSCAPTRLVAYPMPRISRAGRQETDALHRLGVVLRSLSAQAEGELSRASR